MIATGGSLQFSTTIVNCFVLVQLFALVTVTSYTVVVAGVATGLAQEAQDRLLTSPLITDQLYIIAPDTDNATLSSTQIVSFAGIEIITESFKIKSNVSTPVQPIVFVTDPTIV